MIELECVSCEVEMVSGKGKQRWKEEYVVQLLGTGDDRSRWLSSSAYTSRWKWFCVRSNKENAKQCVGARKGGQKRLREGNMYRNAEHSSAYIERWAWLCVRANEDRTGRRKQHYAHSGEGGSGCNHHGDGLLGAL